MFRGMRRKKQELSHNECIEVLERGTSGVLAVLGDDGYPYTVPLSYVLDNGRLLFHSARTGHKIDALKRCDKATFCVIDKDDIVPDEFTTYFRSVVAFGRARILDEEEDRRRALETLAAKYTPDDEEGRLREVDGQIDRTSMIELSIEHLSGKEAIELVRKRQNA